VENCPDKVEQLMSQMRLDFGPQKNPWSLATGSEKRKRLIGAITFFVHGLEARVT